MSDKIECTLDEWLVNGPAICREREMTPEDLVISDKEPIWHCSGTTKSARFCPDTGASFNLITHERHGWFYRAESMKGEVTPKYELPQWVHNGLSINWFTGERETKLALSKYLIEWAKGQ